MAARSGSKNVDSRSLVQAWGEDTLWVLSFIRAPWASASSAGPAHTQAKATPSNVTLGCLSHWCSCNREGVVGAKASVAACSSYGRCPKTCVTTAVGAPSYTRCSAMCGSSPLTRSSWLFSSPSCFPPTRELLGAFLATLACMFPFIHAS